MTDRREFLASTLSAALALALPARARAAEPKKLLILGGSGFLGPHIVERASARGHVMTLFNRGKTNPHLFPQLEKLRGDRRGDLSALERRSFDAVIDTSGYVPSEVASAAAALGPGLGQYLFVSTISVYASLAKPGMDEDAPLATLDDPATDTVTNETYGALKALSEKAAHEALPGRTTVIRPGLIVGPGDPTDRFTYWPARCARGGEVLAPGTPDDPTQFIDARDLAAFVVHCIEQRTIGTYNADAQPGSLTMGRVIDACREATGGESTATWVAAEFLAAQGVAPWSDMPIWMSARGSEAGFGSVSVARAHAAGLSYRPLAATVADTLAWFRTWPAERQQKLRAGLTPEREAAVLAAWHARKTA